LVLSIAAHDPAQPAVAPISIALMLLLSFTGGSGGVLDPQGPIGADLKIMYNALAIMIAIVLPTIVATQHAANASNDADVAVRLQRIDR
jgi:hypothetical protein